MCFNLATRVEFRVSRLQMPGDHREEVRVAPRPVTPVNQVPFFAPVAANILPPIPATQGSAGLEASGPKENRPWESQWRLHELKVGTATWVCGVARDDEPIDN